MISVDGDTSTNDVVCVLANGLAENVDVRNGGKLHIFTYYGENTAAASNTKVSWLAVIAVLVAFSVTLLRK